MHAFNTNFTQNTPPPTALTPWEMTANPSKLRGNEHLEAVDYYHIPEAHHTEVNIRGWSRSWGANTLLQLRASHTDSSTGEINEAAVIDQLNRMLCHQIDVIGELNGQIPATFERRLNPLEYKPFRPRKKFTPEQTIAAFLQHAAYYTNLLRQMLGQEAEHDEKIRRNVGSLKRGYSPVVSEPYLRKHTLHQELKRIWAAQVELPCGLTLAEVQQSDHAKWSEALTMNKGMLDYLVEVKGQIVFFLTMTLPPEYHPNPQFGTTKPWNDAGCPDTEAAHRELHTRWENLRRWLNNRKIKIYGCAVEEPHQDSCPHMHALVAIDPSQKNLFMAGFNKYFPALQANRCIEIKKGEGMLKAASYLTKYMLKTEQDAHNPELRGVDGLDPNPVKAWRSLNNIRTYNFFGFKGFRTFWKWAFVHGHKAVLNPIADNRGHGRYKDTEASHQYTGRGAHVIEKMVHAVCAGDGIQFFALWDAYGNQLKKVVLSADDTRIVVDRMGKAIDEETTTREIRTIGYVFEGDALIQIGANAGAAPCGQLSLIVQETLNTLDDALKMRHFIEIKDIKTDTWALPEWRQPTQKDQDDMISALIDRELALNQPLLFEFDDEPCAPPAASGLSVPFTPDMFDAVQ